MLLDAGKRPKKISFEEMATREDSKELAVLRKENGSLRYELSVAKHDLYWYKNQCNGIKAANRQLLNRLNEVPE